MKIPREWTDANKNPVAPQTAMVFTEDSLRTLLKLVQAFIERES